MLEKCSQPTGIVNEAFTSEEVDCSSSSTDVASPVVKNVSIGSPPKPVVTFTEDAEACGWLSFNPKVLQRFRTSKWVLFFMCCTAATQGMVINGFVNVCITTIEKRYNLKSATAGIIAGSYDVGAVLCTIPVSYLGSLPGASKPRWLGWGILIMGIGSLVFSIPHFASPYYHERFLNTEDPTHSLMLCLKKNVSPLDFDKCRDSVDQWLSSFAYVFILGQFLHGIGASPLYTLGIAYLDESVPMKMSSFYLGIFQCMAVIGPAFGYVLGGKLLDIYIDVPNVPPESLGLGRGNDRWLGAWWIGFVLAGLLAISISWILMAFPAEIPGAKERAVERTEASSHESAKAFAHIRHLPGATLVLLRNLPFVFLSLSQAAEGAMVAGFATFIPKVIENQFGVSAGYAALIVGLVAVPAGGGGTFTGGWLVKYLKLKCEGLLKFCCCISFVCFVCMFAFLLSCPEFDFAGVNLSYDNRLISPVLPSLNSPSCNTNCSCSSLAFNPVCGANDVLYYSPCYAGCSSKAQFGTTQIYSDCSCIKLLPPENGTVPVSVETNDTFTPLPEFSALPQKCSPKCNLLTAFLVVFLTEMFLTFLLTMPAVSATLRCVPDTHRSLALGLEGITSRLLGTIPGPFIFGIVLDGVCSQWQPTCNGTGSCRHYNNARMSRSLTGVAVTFKFLSTVCFGLSWWFYRRKMKQKNSN